MGVKFPHKGTRYVLGMTAEDFKEIVFSPGLEKFSTRLQKKYRRALDEFYKREYYTQEQYEEINARILKGK